GRPAGCGHRCLRTRRAGHRDRRRGPHRGCGERMVGLRTALVYDERCLAHDNGSMLLDGAAQSWLSVPHVESPARIERTVQVLERSGVRERVAPVAARLASEEELRLVHSDEHIATVR